MVEKIKVSPKKIHIFFKAPPVSPLNPIFCSTFIMRDRLEENWFDVLFSPPLTTSKNINLK